MCVCLSEKERERERESEKERERQVDQSKISQWILLKAQLRIYEIIRIFGVPITATVAKVALQPFNFVTL